MDVASQIAPEGQRQFALQESNLGAPFGQCRASWVKTIGPTIALVYVDGTLSANHHTRPLTNPLPLPDTCRNRGPRHPF